MNNKLDHDKFQDSIKQAVAEALNHREEKDRLFALEAAVNDASSTVKELSEELNTITTELSSKEEEVSLLKEEKSTLEASIEELKLMVTGLESAVAEGASALASALESASTAEAKLADIEAAAKLVARMEALEVASVAKRGEAREAQEAYVRNLSDEEFGKYLDERASMRAELIEQLKVEASVEEVEEIVPPADIDTMRSENAAKVAASSINDESDEGEDLNKEYASFGEALAASMRNSKE